MLSLLRKEEKVLGVDRKRRRYDLGLNKGESAGFLTLLICLMTFLALLALAGAFALAAMTDRWSSGLENKMTVEIPAETPGGTVRDRDSVNDLTQRTYEMLIRNPAVVNAQILSDEDISALVKPWLGENLSLADVPVPGLISLELKTQDPKVVSSLSTKARVIAPNIRIDTHEDWLTDLVRFTGALQFASLLLGLVIGVTTVTAVAGAVKARMDVHREEVELLHLMGASDRYICRQFQKHTMWLALKGALAGTLLGALALFVIGLISGEMNINLLPDFTLGTDHILFMAIAPLGAIVISTLTARQTVLKGLLALP